MNITKTTDAHRALAETPYCGGEKNTLRDVETILASHDAAKDERIRELEETVERKRNIEERLSGDCCALAYKLKHAGIAELAASNANLASYVKHWESRAKSAEALVIQQRTALISVHNTGLLSNEICPTALRQANAALALTPTGKAHKHGLWEEEFFSATD